MLSIKLKYKIKRAYSENIGLKLLSLFIAVVLWTLASGERDTEWAYLVPLKITNRPDTLVITNNVPEFLDVRVQGVKSFMMNIEAQELTVELDASDLKTGNNLFPVTPGQIRIPRGAKVTRINPSYITLDAEKRLNKTVKIKGEVQGAPEKDFYVVSVVVAPSKVEITGAESEVKRIRTLKTNSIDISGAKSTVTRETLIDLPGKSVSLAIDKPVTVRVGIKEVATKREMKGVKVKVMNTPHSFSVRPSSGIYLLLEGPKSMVNALKTETLNVFVDAAKLEPGRYSRAVQVELPGSVKLVYSYPKKVSVRLSKK